MRDIVFHELRECNKEIRIMTGEQKESGYKLLLDTVEQMLDLINIVREDGLLSLEETVYNLEENNNSKFLKSMIMLIADGTTPELVEEIGIARYFSAGLEGFEALQYLVILYGSMAIQEGENSKVNEEKLLSLVPEAVVEQYRRQHEDKEYESGCAEIMISDEEALCLFHQIFDTAEDETMNGK